MVVEQLDGTTGLVVLDRVCNPEDYQEERAESRQDDTGGDHVDGAAVELECLDGGLCCGVVTLAVRAGAGDTHLRKPGGCGDCFVFRQCAKVEGDW